MSVLARSAMLLLIMFSALPQAAQASGDLYVTLQGGLKVVKIPIAPNFVTGQPGPTDVVITRSATRGIASRGGELYFNDTRYNSKLGYDIDVINKTPLNPTATGPVAAPLYADAIGAAPVQMTFDSVGNLYFAEGPNIVKIDSQTKTRSIVATLPLNNIVYNNGYGVVFDGVNTLYVSTTAQQNKPAIYKIGVPLSAPTNPGTATVPNATLLVQNLPNATIFRNLRALAMDRAGRLYVGDTRPSATVAGNLEPIIWKLDPKTPNQVSLFSVVASTGEVTGLTFDDVGNLYATSHDQNQIYKIDAAGNSTLFHTFPPASCFTSPAGSVNCQPWGLAFVPGRPPLTFIGRWEPWMALLGGVVFVAVIGGATLILRRRRNQSA